jgi:16S rRNA processing protein RimM
MKKITVAKILKPQGLKGQVKVKPYGNDFSLFKSGLGLFTKDSEELVVSTASVRGDMVYLTFEGLNTIEQIEHLRSQELFVKEDGLDELDGDEYYVKDLIECQVFNEKNELLGTITEIDSYGAADVYTVKNKGSEILFAFVEGVFASVDTKSKKVIVNSQILKEVMV